ncbi:MAG: response regulator [Verrucomicrobiia bacterium]
MSKRATSPSVYVVDDDASLLRALARLLTMAGYGVQTYASASEFLAQHGPQARGCVVADLRMPVMSGLELQAALARSGNPLPVIFLTGHGNIPTSVHAMKRGAEDFLTKPVKKEDLFLAVERALAHDAAAFEQHAHQRELQQHFEMLTPREREVLKLVIAGKLNKEIAASLGAAERTIKAHRASIMEKLQVHSPAELGRIAQEAGLGAVVSHPLSVNREQRSSPN